MILLGLSTGIRACDIIRLRLSDIDWVNDKVMMDRKNQNEDTWNVLKLRMDESTKMLFVMTDNSLRSTWTQKEIDYFKSLNKEILVYQPEEITEKAFEALAGCRKCSVGENGKIEM